jgi:predicted transcriptional regulator
MIVIHYPTAYKALDCFIDTFNENVENKKDRLRTGAVMTAKELIRIYGISLLKANGYQEIKEENLPTLQTNNKQLAKLVKCSSRTIQRHILKLRSAGIVTNKIFHGSNSNFEVLINPKILLVKQKLNVDNVKKEFQEALMQAKKNEAKSGFLKIQKTNCPDTYYSNTSNKINNIIIAVDNSEIKRSSLSLTPENDKGNGTGYIGGYTGEIVHVSLEKQEKNEEKNIQNTGEIVLRVDKLGDRNVPPDSTRDNSLNLYVSLLWMMARNLLYKSVDLTDRQVLIAKKLIKKLYEPVSTPNLSNTHQHYVQRISLVSKYLKRDVNRYVPLPYRYFDTNNPNGFVGTKKWHQADQLRKKEVELELTLSRVIRKYHNNEKRETAIKKPSLQLFRECENTIGKFNDPSLTERFHAAVLNHETYQQISYNN